MAAAAPREARKGGGRFGGSVGFERIKTHACFARDAHLLEVLLEVRVGGVPHAASSLAVRELLRHARLLPEHLLLRGALLLVDLLRRLLEVEDRPLGLVLGHVVLLLVAVVVLQLPHGGEAEPRARLESLATSAVACVSRNSSERFLRSTSRVSTVSRVKNVGLICRNASGQNRARRRERSGSVAARTVVVERADFSLTRRSYHNISLDRNETPPVRVSLAMRGIASSKTSTGRHVSSSRAGLIIIMSSSVAKKLSTLTLTCRTRGGRSRAPWRRTPCRRGCPRTRCPCRPTGTRRRPWRRRSRSRGSSWGTRRRRR